MRRRGGNCFVALSLVGRDLLEVPELNTKDTQFHKVTLGCHFEGRADEPTVGAGWFFPACLFSREIILLAEVGTQGQTTLRLRDFDP